MAWALLPLTGRLRGPAEPEPAGVRAAVPHAPKRSPGVTENQLQNDPSKQDSVSMEIGLLTFCIFIRSQ